MDFLKLAQNPFLFRAYLFRELPLAWIAGLRVAHLDETRCVIQTKLGFWTKNPFRSMYFGVQCMAGEMASGLMAMGAVQNSGRKVSLLVTELESEFTKKAVGTIRFECVEGDNLRNKVQDAVTTGEGVNCTTLTIATDEQGEVVSRFKVTWSFKLKT